MIIVKFWGWALSLIYVKFQSLQNVYIKFLSLKKISFCPLSYGPCAFYLFIATCVSSQVKILLFSWCFLNYFLKIISWYPFHFRGVASTFHWKIKFKSEIPPLHTFKQVAQRATIAHLSPMCQGQISFQKTYKWAMETRGPKSNSSEPLCLSWLPATLMTIW